MDDPPDEVLVGQTRNGSREAFSELVRRHQRKIYGLVFRMTGNHSDADDLAQEVFLTAYRSLSGFKGQSAFYTWIYRIAVNLSLNFLKKRSKEKQIEKLSDRAMAGLEPSQAVESPESGFGADEIQSRLKQAIELLPPVYKATFLLVVREELSHAEAARVMGCSENTISWRMHKARRILQKELKIFPKAA